MTSQDQARHADISGKLLDTDGVKKSLQKAARAAVLEHARAGQQIVVWRDQKVVTEDAQAAE